MGIDERTDTGYERFLESFQTFEMFRLSKRDGVSWFWVKTVLLGIGRR